MLSTLKEREKNTIVRSMERGVIKWDSERKKLVYTEGGKDFKLGERIEEDSAEDSDEAEGQMCGDKEEEVAGGQKEEEVG